ncbi:efflux RND transporter periplasmic adaptor subunit [Phaeobacter porticola]|uniref:Putative efflux transporter, RND family, MFP subunit n=1 Tax=Phaeobacter porticola TaxID=1844006 RepID=A0A1L3I5F6_9RHOB|nr:efflux RND transporter periplasmic adaptor subunit [Phaeobacter porticola]APG47346.1 putative efflux transporter, RND family, MFP subunit [Phaeobacter porticola]
MRVIPLLTAAVVTAGLYYAVIERDTLLSFARGEDSTDTTAAAASDGATAEAATAAGDTAAASTAATPTTTDGNNTSVGVVALRSSARGIDSAVVLRGQTQAIRQVEVRAETTSTVLSEPLRKGAQVKAGDLLCKLDPGTRPSTLLEAKARLREAKIRIPEGQARLDEARARLKEAQINLTAAAKLSEGGFASETRLAAAQAAERSAVAGVATAETGLETAGAGIEAASAQVAASEKELSRLDILAPFDGLLESDTAELGSLMQPGSLCATVIQLETIKLVGYVPEAEVNRVTIGAMARAELANGRLTAGKVTFISRSADPTTRTFEVEITVPNPDLAIRDGQTADIVISAEGSKAHYLPQSSLTLNNDGQLGVRVVNTDQTVGFYPVSLLRDEANGVWVGGLPEQADVIVVGQDFVVAGVTVAPTYQEVSQ